MRWGVIFGISIAALIATTLLTPIPQPQSYHQFADQRTIFGIAHGLDVISNLAFLVSGLLGLLFVARFASALDSGTRWAFATLFFGLVLTSIGSAYYHLAPDNQRLVFDRLPMVIAMAGCGGAVLADRFGGKTVWAVAPLLATGLWTVFQWRASEAAGHGDLRWYALYQGLIILAGALLLWMFPSRNRATPFFVIAVAGNVLAKLFELLDRPIYALGGVVSGHTLKHLCAGLSFLPLVFLMRRTEREQRMNHMAARLTSAICFLVVVVSTGAFPQAKAPAPPPTRQDNVKETIHGVEIVDPYRWLEDQQSEETRNWVTAQNTYTHSLLDGLPMRPRAYERLLEMANHDSQNAPYKENGYYFFAKRTAGADLWSVYRRKGLDGKDELLLDPLPLSPDHTTSIGNYLATQDASLLLYSIRKGGEDESELHILDLTTHHDLPDVLPRAFYLGYGWKKDKSGFFYARSNRDTGKRIYYHALGADPASDVEMFGKGYGPDVWVGPVVSRDGHYLLASVSKGWASDEIFIKDLAADSEFRPLITGLDSHFDVAFAGDFLIVQTDWKAPRYRILKIDLRHPEQENWKEIVPAAGDAIDGFTLIGDKLFVNYLHNVATHISIFSMEGKPLGEVPLPGIGSANMGGRFGEDEGILGFSSYTAPYSSYLYHSATGKQDLWYRTPVPFDSSRYETEQFWCTSKDGTRVPMFLIHRKGLKPTGHTPTILYGYGGFNYNLTPGFDSLIAWWIEQGGLYVVANLRGGGEFGEEWHKAGMLGKKQNVFDDFIAAAEWLIRNKYTTPEKLAIRGGSNGGLLVGAALTQRPELFRAVDCWHPDLDMVRYYKFTKNNNPPALLEYGNAEDPEQFKFLYAYSPYQKVKPGTKYPAVLMISGDADTRVPPEQARKMTARLQAATSSGLPVVLLYDTKAGHSGGKPLKKAIEDEALELSFLAWQLGLTQPAKH